MFRSSLVPPEVFTAYANKHKAARMQAIRDRMKLQMNVGNAGSRPEAKSSQAGRPMALAGRQR